MTSVRRDYFKEGREFVTLTLIAKNNLGHQKRTCATVCLMKKNICSIASSSYML